jgi:hypothetical protein
MCRGVEATGPELAALREQALWDLLTLFFLEGAGGGSEGQGLVSQVRGMGGGGPFVVACGCARVQKGLGGATAWLRL